MSKKKRAHGRGLGYVCSSNIGFVPVPNIRGYYMKVHLCVIFCSCEYCDSKPGVPCKSKGTGYIASTHAVRRDSWREEKRKYSLEKAIVIETTVVTE